MIVRWKGTRPGKLPREEPACERHAGDHGHLPADRLLEEEVRGPEAIERIFVHMFQQLDSPRFVVIERAVDGDTAWLTWDLEYRMKPGQPMRRIHGASQLRFDADGRVRHHRDYWDAAGELYETFPLLGGLLRMLRKRLGAS